MGSPPDTFSLAITSDPQYPWYDNVFPEGLEGEEAVRENSERQIREQYESINAIAESGPDGSSPVQGVVINGDLTSFGHLEQLEKFEELSGILSPPVFPALGNHDYANNVNECVNNNCATNMAMYMVRWLLNQSSFLNSYDLSERGSYQFPEIRTDYSGSLSYSLNLGPVHLVMLHNFPSYADEWNSWAFEEAQRRFFFVKPSFYWLTRDLVEARNRGDAILVFLHDYNDNFIGEPFEEFRELMSTYGVSAVFCGHIHRECGPIDSISSPHSSRIPVFRSGAASYQDYLVARLDLTEDSLEVTRYSAPYPGGYEAGETWSSSLDRTTPEPELPVPRPAGYVTFYNAGGFEAAFELRYKDYNGNMQEFQTEKLLLGNKVTFEIPPYATEIQLKGEENTGRFWEEEPWWTVFNLTYQEPPNKCFRLFGTTWNPQWDNRE